ncbi:hypothetical protein [Balneola sp. MJW-20]|uniref:hypothetical protein n=1 Tax=Gracilimonas aurantiaca TaxID=3234185 RepID=UPI0034C14CF4
MLKKILLMGATCMFLGSTVNAQWLTNMSCTEDASEIMNKAINHQMNLEQQYAAGMAKAALVIDENCGSAQLLLAQIALGNGPNGLKGSADEKMGKIRYDDLSDQEKAWYDMENADGSTDFWAAIDAAVTAYPDAAMFAYRKAVRLQDGKDDIGQFIAKFPEESPAAYNTMAYRQSGGAYGEEDIKGAMESIRKGLAIYNGPNLHDSMAEHYAMMGNYEKAVEHEFKALDFASGPSVYGTRLTNLWFRYNQDTHSDSIKAYTMHRINHLMDGDNAAAQEYLSGNGSVQCDSNLRPCRVTGTGNGAGNNTPRMRFERWDVSDMEIWFNDDMTMAITSYMNDGEITITSSGETIPYKTRASEVWVREAGWKIVHSNFAPLKEGTGVPAIND